MGITVFLSHILNIWCPANTFRRFRLKIQSLQIWCQSGLASHTREYSTCHTICNFYFLHNYVDQIKKISTNAQLRSRDSTPGRLNSRYQMLQKFRSFSSIRRSSSKYYLRLLKNSTQRELQLSSINFLGNFFSVTL